MNPIWFLRAKRWAQRPPSAARVKLVLAVIAICAALYGLELAGLWPEWLTLDAPHGRRSLGVRVVD